MYVPHQHGIGHSIEDDSPFAYALSGPHGSETSSFQKSLSKIKARNPSGFAVRGIKHSDCQTKPDGTPAIKQRQALAISGY